MNGLERLGDLLPGVVAALSHTRNGAPMAKFTPTAMLPRLDPDDAAWLLVLVENAVPNDTSPGSRMNWEGKGRQYAYELLAKAAGAQLLLCGVNGCPLSDMHSGGHVEPAVDGAA